MHEDKRPSNLNAIRKIVHTVKVQYFVFQYKKKSPNTFQLRKEKLQKF